MIKGSCLCGGVRFEISRTAGPFELCHCRRCRKATGSAFAAGLYVRAEDFQFLEGKDLISTYEAPIVREPPPYVASFCRRCGSPVPYLAENSTVLEIPAGLLDDDPGLRPDKHIFIDVKSPWFEIADRLPQYDLATLIKLRSGDGVPP